MANINSLFVNNNMKKSYFVSAKYGYYYISIKILINFGRMT